METELFLNDIWSVYFHNPISNNWDRDGYIKIADISSIEDFWKVYNELNDQIHNGMFFFMREHIFPTWDDPLNKDGSFLSFKVLKDKIEEFSVTILMRMLGETILVDEERTKWDCVNGVSFSPKKNFCIVKIWFKNKSLKAKNLFNLPNSYQGEIVFKDNSM